MKTLVLDAELLAKLGGGPAKVTLTDGDGKVIGHYVPDDLYCSIRDAIIPPYEEDPRAAAIEEMRRGDVVTTAELIAGIKESLRRWTGEE